MNWLSMKEEELEKLEEDGVPEMVTAGFPPHPSAFPESSPQDQRLTGGVVRMLPRPRPAAIDKNRKIS